MQRGIMSVGKSSYLILVSYLAAGTICIGSRRADQAIDPNELKDLMQQLEVTAKALGRTI